MEPVYISHSIDEPKVIFGRLMKPCHFSLLSAVGIITGRLLPMIILGVVVSRVYGGFLASLRNILHLCYWKFESHSVVALCT